MMTLALKGVTVQQSLGEEYLGDPGAPWGDRAGGQKMKEALLLLLCYTPHLEGAQLNFRSELQFYLQDTNPLPRKEFS